MCVYIHPIMIKIHQLFFFFIPILKSSFSNQAVLRFLSEWRRGRSHDSWLTRLSYLRPALSELSSVTIVSTPVQGKTRCLRLSDWGALLLDVIMNIAVVTYSRHLSRWRCRGLTLLKLWSECAHIPDLSKYIYVQRESFLIQHYLQNKE